MPDELPDDEALPDDDALPEEDPLPDEPDEEETPEEEDPPEEEEPPSWDDEEPPDVPHPFVVHARAKPRIVASSRWRMGTPPRALFFDLPASLALGHTHCTR